MRSDFPKFPPTPHLAWLGEGNPRDDKVLEPTDRNELLRKPIVVEEKVDGANVGISFDAEGSPTVQNRGTFLSAHAHPQFHPLWHWLAKHREKLASLLEDRLVLFGEWLFAVHSVRYDHLPDWFLAFDIYENGVDRFWSSERRDTAVRSAGLFSVPVLGAGTYRLSQLEALLTATQSRYAWEPIEGLYIRSQTNGWLWSRAKLVRPEFNQSIHKHWAARPLVRNALSETIR